jgi:hypothetical protein
MKKQHMPGVFPTCQLQRTVDLSVETLFSSAGYEVTGILAGYDGRNFTKESSDLVIVARKP